MKEQVDWRSVLESSSKTLKHLNVRGDPFSQLPDLGGTGTFRIGQSVSLLDVDTSNSEDVNSQCASRNASNLPTQNLRSEVLGFDDDQLSKSSRPQNF